MLIHLNNGKVFVVVKVKQRSKLIKYLNSSFILLKGNVINHENI